MLRKNDGFTLVELMITIAIGSLITLAATTTLLLGLRIHAKNAETIVRQNTTNMLVQVLNKVANADAQDSQENLEIRITTSENSAQINEIRSSDTSIRFENNCIVLNNVVFMEDVESFDLIKNEGASEKKLLNVQLTTTDGNTYNASVYCRTREISYEQSP